MTTTTITTGSALDALFPQYKTDPVYLVYFHVDFDGVVMYIGKGKGKRPWSKARSKDHLEWINNCQHEYVEIVAEGLSERAAFALEHKNLLSGEYSPRFNEVLRRT